jgi:hypothetical protein
VVLKKKKKEKEKEKRKREKRTEKTVGALMTLASLKSLLSRFAQVITVTVGAIIKVIIASACLG